VEFRNALRGQPRDFCVCNMKCGHIGPFLPCKSKPSTLMRRCAATGPAPAETRQIARCSKRLRGFLCYFKGSAFVSMPLEKTIKLATHPSVKRIEVEAMGKLGRIWSTSWLVLLIAPELDCVWAASCVGEC
jgi:hypothetical protein